MSKIVKGKSNRKMISKYTDMEDVSDELNFFQYVAGISR